MRYAPIELMLLSCVLWTGTVSRTHADNWPNWRGPGERGVAAPGDYPIEWDADKNILWTAEMPGQAGSTPIVWDDRIYLTAAHDGKNVARCYDWDGKLLWETQLGDERPGKHKKASGSNSSPVTDGQHIYVYFKSGDLACLDRDGEKIWQINLQSEFGEDTLWWDLGTSPVLTQDCVVVAVVQSGPSYVVAFDKSTGEVAWKVDRVMDAPEEANQSYSTPLVIQRDGQELVVVLGADHVTGHDATTGREVWRVGGFNPKDNGYNRSIASQVYVDGVIVTPYDRGTSLTGISLDGDVLWRRDEPSADVPTPAAKDGKAYVCSDKGRLTCIDAKTGEELWSVETGKNRNAFSASPILADDHVYLIREDGAVFVVDTQGEHSIVATNQVDGFTVSTPVFANGRILIRTAKHLYCIGHRG